LTTTTQQPRIIGTQPQRAPAQLRTPSIGSMTLLFLEPPAGPVASHDDDTSYYQDPPANRPASQPAGSGGSDLRMLRAAREAATGMGISANKIRAVVENPDEVGPDERNPSRMRLLGGGLEIIVGTDGMILRVLRHR
jgi:hypothetical protein